MKRRNNSLKNPPPPRNQPSKIPSNSSKESVLGNMVGGMVSGFGIGTGIEAAKGLGNKIFGNKEYTPETNTNNKDNCQLLSDMINKCNQNNEYNNNCDNLLKIFSEKCLSDQ